MLRYYNELVVNMCIFVYCHCFFFFYFEEMENFFILKKLYLKFDLNKIKQTKKGKYYLSYFKIEITVKILSKKNKLKKI